MLPDIWGKSMWKTIHIIALAYPNNPNDIDRKTYRDFFVNLYGVIPCYSCAQNYQQHLQQLPIDNYLGNGDELFEWTVEMHNLVNKMLNKRTYTPLQAKKMYLYEQSTLSITLIISIIALLVVISLLIKKRYG
jgi:hypothetical protein